VGSSSSLQAAVVWVGRLMARAKRLNRFGKCGAHFRYGACNLGRSLVLAIPLS
jgi:hypothetical protein